jgi:uncharacterized protein (TIGR03083 family)
MIRELIAEDRRGLAGMLEGLSDEQWEAPSLCAGWQVRHVVAHVTMPLRYTTAQFLLGMAKARGNFQRMSDGVARRDAGLPRRQLVAALAENADHPWKPPAGGFEAALTHEVIHGLDITGALGIEREIPAPAMTAVLDTITGPVSLKHFGVELSGLELAATDLDWTWGSGSPVRGRAEHLALMLTGRRVPDGALTGAAPARGSAGR